MPPRSPLTLGLLAAAALLAPPATARAADLDENYGYAEAPQEVPVASIPQTKVEFGTGWYVRGDLAATSIPKVGASTPTNESINGIFYDNAPALLFSNGNRIGYTASLGAGYSFLNGFRADFIADFHQPLSSSVDGAPYNCQNGYLLHPSVTTSSTVNGVTSSNTSAAYSTATYGTCTGHYASALKSYDVLVNGYYDIGHWYGVTPYVGAGIGLAFGHYSTGSTYTQADGTSYNINITEPVTGSTFHIYEDRFASGNYYNFAFALMVGFTYDIFPHTKLDIGYRYLHEGRVYSVDLYEHEARAGLRYMIDN